MLDSADAVEELLAALGSLPVAGTDAACVDQLAGLERVKSAVCAAQVRVTTGFAESRRAALAGVGVSAAEAGRSIGSQVALARRESPTRGSQHLGFAEALVTDMPGTLAALERGEVSEWRATLVVRETAVLSREHRRAVDAELSPRLAGLGDGAVAREARRIGTRLDTEAAWRRARRAVQGSRVSVRPLPDAMGCLSVVAPIADCISAYKIVSDAADFAAGVTGDEPVKGRGQIMAQTLLQRVTGAGSDSDAAVRSGTRHGLEVQLVMTDRALLAGSDEPAEVLGHGPIPARLARELIADAIASGAGGFVQRLLSDPAGRLVAAESRRRIFPPAMARFLRVRDSGTYRTPWCDAPIRHIDHVRAAEHGGATSIVNGEGLCERCNYTKQGQGWGARTHPDGSITITTPTGHTYANRPPPLPGAA